MIDELSDLIPSYSWLYLPIAVLAIWAAKKYRNTETFFSSEREKRFSLLYGCAFVSSYIAGTVLSSGGMVNRKSILFVLVSCLLFSPPVGLAYRIMTRKFGKFCSAASDMEYAVARHPMLFSAGLMLFCWLPFFLALYPGVFAYDVAWQLPQTTNPNPFFHYGEHHPLIHTLYLQGFYAFGGIIGSRNAGMALSVIVQMVAFAASLAYAIQYLVEKRMRKAVVLTVLGFFSCFPLFPILAVSMTKDIFFAAAFHAAFIKLLKLRDSGYDFSERRDWALLILFFVLAGLLRNNAKYAVCMVVVFFWLQAFINRSRAKKLCVVGLVTIVLMLACSNALRIVLHANPAPMSEVMSEPYQQLARIYKYDKDALSESDRETARRLLPDIENYHESISDVVKNTAIVYVNPENRKTFWDIYFRGLWKRPARCAEAFMIMTKGYWYVDDVSSSRIYADEMQGIVLVLDTAKDFGVSRDSKLPALENLIKRLFHDNEYQIYPLAAPFFNMGFYLWLMLAALFYCAQTRRKGLAAPLVFLWGYMATVAFGPCALFRYALPYIVCIPALMAVAYHQSNAEMEEEELNG